MRRLYLVPVFLCAATASNTGQAADWYTGAPQSGVAAPAQFGAAIDTAVTADTKGSRYATLIGTIAPFTPVDESGMRVRLMGVLGQYSYIASSPYPGRTTGTQETGSFLVGYEWVSKRSSVAVYLGGDVTSTTLSRPDPNNTAQGTAGGAKIGVDFYYRPTDAFMLSGVASYATAHNAYYGRFKAGFAVAPDVFIGPEAIALGDNFDNQWRAGVHVTGAKLGFMQFGASGGFLSDKLNGKGAYGILDARLAF